LQKLDAITQIEIDAIVSFVRAGVPYQSRVARIMRTVSEALHFGGEYCNSTKGKTVNLRMSRQAALLLENSTKKEFAANTILEHPRPIEHIYNDLIAKRADVFPKMVIDKLGHYPLVTVTKKENQNLKHKGWESPVSRYKGIEVGEVSAIAFGKVAHWKPKPFTDLPP
jgi:hypothetical protein